MTDRLYYADPFLSAFDARVTDIREASRTDGQSLWQIALDRSAFYPTSGGQPYDTGTLTASAPSGATLEAPILSVEEDDGGEVWHATAKPLLAGTAVHGAIDWPRRLDHMQQHSGQHLLSAILDRELSAATVSFHLGEAVSTIDLAAEKLAPEALARVEARANEAIAEDRPISIRTVSHAEAESLLASGALRKLPPREGAIRLIEIAGIDQNACGGTHLRSTGQIGGLLLRGTERVRGGLRLGFVCGLRAVTAAREDFAALSRAGAALSAGRAEVPEAVERLLAESKAAGKRHQKALETLAGYHAARLVEEEPIERGVRIVRRVFDDPAQDAAYLKLLASRTVAAAPRTAVLFAASSEEPGPVVFGRSRDFDLACGALLREALAAFGVRGGGSPEMAQALVPRAHLDALFDALSRKARGDE